MLFRNETNKTDFIHLYCRDISGPMEYCRAVYTRNKQLEPFTYFTPKQFKEYVESESSEEPVKVVGNVHLYQKEYKGADQMKTIGDFETEKKEQGIYGSFRVSYSGEYLKKHKGELCASKCKKFDLYEAKDVHCMGYAQVGAKRFVRLIDVSKLEMATYIALWLGAIGLIFKFGLLINDYGAVNLT